jgi:hypothetical protein
MINGIKSDLGINFNFPFDYSEWIPYNKRSDRSVSEADLILLIADDSVKN